jgi:hypothetical protein
MCNCHLSNSSPSEKVLAAVNDDQNFPIIKKYYVLNNEELNFTHKNGKYLLTLPS